MNTLPYLEQLNRSVVPRKRTSDGQIKEFRLDNMNNDEILPQIKSLETFLSQFDLLIAQAPPDTGPRRFGNVAFRTWSKLAGEQADTLLRAVLPETLHPALKELEPYLLGSFGSAQRLDYGTGHELSFLAFLACLWKIHYFDSASTDKDIIACQIVLCLVQPYLTLIRRLIMTYNLEPAGSHGVWGLDDNSFLPYVFGSAQYSPPVLVADSTLATSEDRSASVQSPILAPTSGSLIDAPPPGLVTNANETARLAVSNMYFSAISFIHRVKRGPFWEHSPVLYDISGIKDGWAKINKGMIKMYEAEVLGKFPVVQHFPFGGLLSFTQDPDARTIIAATTHTQNQPLRNPLDSGDIGNGVTAMPRPSSIPLSAISRARGANGLSAESNSSIRSGVSVPKGFVDGVTRAPWAGSTAAGRSMPPPLKKASHATTLTDSRISTKSAANCQGNHTGSGEPDQKKS